MNYETIEIEQQPASIQNLLVLIKKMYFMHYAIWCQCKYKTCK